MWNSPVQPGREAGTGAAASASWPSLVGVAWDADPRLALALRQRFPGAGLDAALAPRIVDNAHDPTLQVHRMCPHRVCSSHVLCNLVQGVLQALIADSRAEAHGCGDSSGMIVKPGLPCYNDQGCMPFSPAFETQCTTCHAMTCLMGCS